MLRPFHQASWDAAASPISRHSRAGDRLVGLSIKAMLEMGSTMDYEDQVESIMNIKYGLMRGECQAGKVLGSLRTVAIPAVGTVRGTVLVPYRLLNRIMCSMASKDTEMIESGPASTLEWAMTVRPPSIYQGSVMPVRVVGWNRTATGLPLDHYSDMHADFDGDEVHLYFMGYERSVAEMKEWSLDFPVPSLHVMAYRTSQDPWTHMTTRRSGTTSLIEAYDGPMSLDHNVGLVGIKPQHAIHISSRMSPAFNKEAMMSEAEQGCTQVMRQRIPLGSRGAYFQGGDYSGVGDNP